MAGFTFLFLAIVALIIGLVGVIRPLPRFGIRNWRHAGAVIGAGFVLLVVGVIALPKESPQEAATRMQKEAFARGELTGASVAAISGLSDVTDVLVTNLSDGAKGVSVSWTVTSAWDDAALVRSAGDAFVKIAQQLFADPKVGQVEVIAMAKFHDQYGKETTEPAVTILWSRATADKVDFAKFKDMAVLDYKNVLRISDRYSIHPGVYKNLKDNAEFPLSGGAAK